MLPRSVALVLVLLASCGEDKGGGSGGAETDAPNPSTTSTGPTSTTAPTSSSDATTDSTTGEPAQFERFTLRSAAGPCPPDADCDGFVELLSTRLLRVEKFGDLSEFVTEVEIDEADFAEAVAVFTDPELIALLAEPGPLCDPPTDVFESMELAASGQVHSATTTGCDQPPLAAARMTASALREQYAP
jgi:hypothetical protein